MLKGIFKLNQKFQNSSAKAYENMKFTGKDNYLNKTENCSTVMFVCKSLIVVLNINVLNFKIKRYRLNGLKKRSN